MISLSQILQSRLSRSSCSFFFSFPLLFSSCFPLPFFPPWRSPSLSGGTCQCAQQQHPLRQKGCVGMGGRRQQPPVLGVCGENPTPLFLENRVLLRGEVWWTGKYQRCCEGATHRRYPQTIPFGIFSYFFFFLSACGWGTLVSGAFASAASFWSLWIRQWVDFSFSFPV